MGEDAVAVAFAEAVKILRSSSHLSGTFRAFLSGIVAFNHDEALQSVLDALGADCTREELEALRDLGLAGEAQSGALNALVAESCITNAGLPSVTEFTHRKLVELLEHCTKESHFTALASALRACSGQNLDLTTLNSRIDADVAEALGRVEISSKPAGGSTDTHSSSDEDSSTSWFTFFVATAEAGYAELAVELKRMGTTAVCTPHHDADFASALRRLGRADLALIVELDSRHSIIREAGENKCLRIGDEMLSEELIDVMMLRCQHAVVGALVDTPIWVKIRARCLEHGGAAMSTSSPRHICSQLVSAGVIPEAAKIASQACKLHPVLQKDFASCVASLRLLLGDIDGP